jgi:hypothetical protein
MFQARKRFSLKNWISANKNKTYEDLKLFLESRDVLPPSEDLFSNILKSSMSDIIVEKSETVVEEISQEEVVPEVVEEELVAQISETVQEEAEENKSTRRSRNKRRKQSVNKDEKESSQ